MGKIQSAITGSIMATIGAIAVGKKLSTDTPDMPDAEKGELQSRADEANQIADCYAKAKKDQAQAFKELLESKDK